MKIRSLMDGHDGFAPVKAGEIVERDTDWARRALVNGLAVPEDDQAATLATDERARKRYASGALQSLAIELAAGRKAAAAAAAVTTSESARVEQTPA